VDLWWKKWQGDRFFSEFFSFPINNNPPWFSIAMYHLRMNNRPIGGLSLEIQFHPINMNNKNNGREFLEQLNILLASHGELCSMEIDS
jgi:hypothetical protein